MLNRLHRFVLLVIASSLACSVGVATGADAVRYQLKPESTFLYLPSPESAGENCSPSRFRCEFGLAGSFDYSWDRNTGLAHLSSVELTLTGNDELIGTLLATSSGLSQWLAGRTFEDQHVLGPFTTFADKIYPHLLLTDTYDGTLSLLGGYDDTPADGIGIDFRVHASSVPEPASTAAIVSGLFVVVAAGRAVRRASV